MATGRRPHPPPSGVRCLLYGGREIFRGFCQSRQHLPQPVVVVGWRQMKPTLIALLMCLSLPLAGADKDKPVAGKDAAVKAYDEGRYADAVRLFAAELAKEDAKPKPDWMELSYYNSYLGLAHDEAGQYDKALEFYHKALAIYLVKLGKDHPSVASTYNNIAIVHE